MDEPKAVLAAAMQQLQQQGGGGGGDTGASGNGGGGGGGGFAPPPPAFLPAPRFSGAKPGYFFGTGARGTGYYRDPKQKLAKVLAAAAAASASGGGGAAFSDGNQRGAGAGSSSGDELLRRAEEAAAADEVQLLDERSLRRMLHALERAAKANLELRLKHADEPLRFLDSDVELAGLVKGLAQITGDPNALYPLLAGSSGAVAALAALLSHDNTDIALEVVDLLQELTDADEEQDNAAVAGRLVDALLEANAPELLVDRLARLDERVDEEAGGVNSALAFIEHALELRPALAEPLVARTKLLAWLLARVRAKASDSNRLAASEVLAILVGQGHEANAAALGAAGGIDALLVALAPYKGRDPADAEEQETVENLFDALCSCLLLPANRAAFVEAEGVELMVLLLKSKRAARYGAVRALDFATTRSPAACDRLVDAGGLAQLFAVFMGRAKVRSISAAAAATAADGGRDGAKRRQQKQDRDAAREVEERCVSIVANLFQGLERPARRDRVAAKFVEAEFEKADRLLELLLRHADAVAACEARLRDEAALLGEEEVDASELLLERLDAGLFTAQCAAVSAAALWATGDAGLRRRLLAVLHQRGHTLGLVRRLLLEFHGGLGDDGAPEERAWQAARLAQLLRGLGVEVDDEQQEQQQEQQGEPQAEGLDDPQQQQQQRQEPQGNGASGDEAAAAAAADGSGGEDDGRSGGAGDDKRSRRSRSRSLSRSPKRRRSRSR